MADHNLPQTTSTYSNFVSELDARFDDIAKLLASDTVTATNLPTGAIRWNATSNTFQKWSGTAWAALTSSYSININGTVGATTPASGKFTTLETSGVATLAANSTVDGKLIATLDATQTLSNKTLDSPTIDDIVVAGNTLQLPAGPDTLVGEKTQQTLENKTLTQPKFADGGYIADSNGNEILEFDSINNAVNHIAVLNSVTNTAPAILAAGTNTNINLNLRSKGTTGLVQINGVAAVDVSTQQTLSNKTLTLPKINDTSSDHTYTFSVGELTANRTISLPALTQDDSFVFATHTQSLSNKTLTSPSLYQPMLVDANLASGHLLTLINQTQGSSKNVYIPNVTNNDVFVFNATAATLTNKTINGTNNTISNISLTTAVTGTLPIGNGGTGQATAATAFDALKQSASTSYVGAVQLATSNEVQIGTSTTKAMTPDAFRQGAIVPRTYSFLNTLTLLDWLSIPSWVTRITLVLADVSTNGTSPVIVQIGDSGGIETTGYKSGASFGDSAGAFATSATGFLLDPNNLAVASYARHGIVTLMRVGGDSASVTWSYASNIYSEGGQVVGSGAGTKTLSTAILDRVRLTTAGGTNTFDSGSVRLYYE